MEKYKPDIGMEIHVELKTESKMFCNSKNGMGMDKEPNVNICPICTGQPGTLPVPNRKAIEFVQKVGIALNCELARSSKFDRKNYFYPDIPKGYQISQYDKPLCGRGEINVNGKKFGITRIHIEEDTGKLIHPKGVDYTLVDFNRAGTPLMELVTEPDFESGQEARLFCQKLRQVCRYLGVSDADMEKGHMRCEANISLCKEGRERLSGTKVEVKNINSFKFVEKAIAYEIERQTEVLQKGEKIIQETRGWDSNRGITVSQRKKESAHDYRYFPEPDIPPMNFSDEEINQIKFSLPELPWEKEERFAKEYGLDDQSIQVLTDDKYLAEYFEDVVSEMKEKIQAGETKINDKKLIKLASNYIQSELMKHLAATGDSIQDIKIKAEDFAELMTITAEGKINSSATQVVLDEMYKFGGDPSHIIEVKNLSQESDESALGDIVNKIINENAQSVEDYKNGKDKALQYLVGCVMKETKGKANPSIVVSILKNKINKEN